MGPDPMTSSRSGSSVWFQKDTLVRYGTELIPGVLGILALAPVAMTAVAKESVCPLTSTVDELVNFA